MSRCDTGYIKLCPTCEHYPNDKHCVGCTWDKDTGDNTKWESRTVIDRKVIDDIKAEIEDLDIHFDNDYFSGNRDSMLKRDEVLQIIDKHIKGSEDEKS